MEQWSVTLVMWLSATIHAWAGGLGWHFWLRHYDLGPWFYLPLVVTSLLTWVLLGAALGELGELIGLWKADD